MKCIDDLIVEVCEKATLVSMNSLLEELKSQKPLSAEIAEKLDTIWESWNTSALSMEQAMFCINVAELQSADSQQMCKVTVAAVKKLLPPYLSQPPVMRAIGLKVKDDATSLEEAPAVVAKRQQRLIELKQGTVLFIPSSHRWGITGSIDGLKATVLVSGFSRIAVNSSVPLETILKEAYVFRPSLDLPRYVTYDKTRLCPSSSKFRAIVRRQSIFPLTDEEMIPMAQSGCALKMTPEEFEKYWTTVEPETVAQNRNSSTARSLQEMEKFLTDEAKAKASAFSDGEIESFKGFFTKLNAGKFCITKFNATKLDKDSVKKETERLVKVVAMLVERTTQEQQKVMFTPLQNKAPFWPADPEKVELEKLSAWGEAKADEINGLTMATAAVFSKEYIVSCALRLPLKALNSFCEKISTDDLFDAIIKNKNYTADMLLWIWKNKKKLSGSQLLTVLNLSNVVKILGNAEPPKEWGASRRELNGLLIGNKIFQKYLVEEMDENGAMISATLQGATFLTKAEREKLIVGFSEISDNVRKYIEHGGAEKIMDAGAKEEVQVPMVDEPLYTSVHSQKALVSELDDLNNVQIPANREAVKTAAAHGDFRENSEFAAAKERRTQLQKRKEEIERYLGRLAPMVMAQVKVTNKAVIGSEIEIEYDDGKKEIRYLLGAHDVDPKRHFQPYNTSLGKAVRNLLVGEEFSFNIEAKKHHGKLLAVRPLPAELIKELDN